MQDLPADILFLVCEELARKRDFATLFTCAVSSKSLVKPALLWMYRYATYLLPVKSFFSQYPGFTMIARLEIAARLTRPTSREM
jgi:hypothetical protein